MAQSNNPKTPGVYLNEAPSFPPSIVGVETSAPAFIGYTKIAEVDGKSVVGKPVKIASLADYEAIFGGDAEVKFTIDGAGGAANLSVSLSGPSRFLLYRSIKLFYENGGASCWVVSVGLFAQEQATKSELLDGLAAIQIQNGPTMLAIPDASLLAAESDFNDVALEMLKQSGANRDRIALLDVWQARTLTQAELPAQLNDRIQAFRAGIGDKFLDYGAAYFPYLNTALAQASDWNFTNFLPAPALVSVLQAQVEEQYPAGSPERRQILGYIAQMNTVTAPADIAALDTKLTAAIPLLKQIYAMAADKFNVLPPSPAMAGVMTFTDKTRGVWTAPANVALNSVIAPALSIDDDQQSALNLPLEGKAINAIRYFAGRGSLVWGARTLDGNSLEWRYIQVRRTVIYIEQSIQQALNQYVFAPNDSQTWVSVTSMISGFLQELWLQGGLFGSTAQEAYTASCGLGSTMTAQDILDGYLLAQATVQLIFPGDLTVLTFKQKMEESS